jgi:hypothetical protein
MASRRYVVQDQVGGMWQSHQTVSTANDGSQVGYSFRMNCVNGEMKSNLPVGLILVDIV